jgi:hypothetical protein
MPTNLEDHVRSAFDRATDGNGSPDELLLAVRVLVRDLKKEGRPPEKIIVALKQLCGLPLITFAADTDAEADSLQSKQICDMMVRAVIDEYYRKTRSNGASSEAEVQELES